MTLPTLPDVIAYLEAGSVTVDASEVEKAYRAEVASQARRCRVPEGDDYPDDLGEAIRRRVARNLALRGVPLGVYADDVGGTIVGSQDPEVRRLEAPWRRATVG